MLLLNCVCLHRREEEKEEGGRKKKNEGVSEWKQTREELLYN